MITLKTLPTTTKQEIFDQVSQHLLEQDRQSKDGSHCKYRSQDGLKCAAGCLIDDSEYKDSMEGLKWLELVYRDIVPRKHNHIITTLQSIHDTTSPDEWKESLKELAEQHDLKWNF